MYLWSPKITKTVGLQSTTTSNSTVKLNFRFFKMFFKYLPTEEI